MATKRQVALLCLLLLSAACGRADQNSGRGSETARTPRVTAGNAPAQTAVTALEPPEGPSIHWPPGWKVLESGASGDIQTPLFWYTLEPAGLAPAAAIDQALAAIGSASGPFEWKGTTTASDGQMIAQFRSPRFRGALSTVAQPKGWVLKISIERSR